MDLGIHGKKAIVCAASKGLGKATAMSLAENGVDVVICARTKVEIEAAAKEIADATGVTVTPIACDITTPEGRAAVLDACPEPDILINNAGGPPPGNFRDWDDEAWLKAVNNNMLTPINLIKSTVDGMIAREFGRIVNITSAAVKAPIPVLGLSNGARAGLTGFVAGTAREVAKHNVTINSVLPGQFATDRLTSTMKGAAEKSGKSFDDYYVENARMKVAGRYGYPQEFGELCTFLCGQHAGYIAGQNIVIDGGQFPGTL